MSTLWYEALFKTGWALRRRNAIANILAHFGCQKGQMTKWKEKKHVLDDHQTFIIRITLTIKIFSSLNCVVKQSGWYFKKLFNFPYTCHIISHIPKPTLKINCKKFKCFLSKFELKSSVQNIVKFLSSFCKRWVSKWVITYF